MKKITTILLVVLLVLTCVTMFACNKFDAEKAELALKSYIFEEEGKVVSGEFVLPGNIGGFDATWTSSDDIIKITEIPANPDAGTERQYLATVGYPDEAVDVILTIALSEDVKKDYIVYVNPLSVHDFIDSYNFVNDKMTVVKDFALDRTVELAGKTATITWSVDAQYADYLEISEDGNTCHVYPTSLNPTVYIKATFAYGGETASLEYRMIVSDEKEHLQEVDYWYSNTGVGMTMTGYVVEIATVWSEQYSNVSLYIVDEDFCAGYYLYRVKCDAATAEKLVPGAPVICTGTMNTDYNGLYETNSGGEIVIDETREAINVNDTVYAIDNEIIGGLKSANYHQSTLVSLTNWKVKQIKEVDATQSTQTLFIVTKGGVDVPVIVSKYHEGSYTRGDENVWKALLNHGLQEGDIVSITGILGNYNGHQIAPISASHIVKGGTEDPADTVYPGKTAKTAVDAIDKFLNDNGLTAPVVAVGSELTLPTSAGATIETKVLNGESIKVEGGKLIVTPGKLSSTCVRFDITVGEFKTVIFRYIKTADLDAEGKLELEVDELDVIKSATLDTTVELPTEGTLFDGVTIGWSFKADSAHDCATLDGNVLTITLPAEATTITIVATLTLGETTVDAEFEIEVAAAVVEEYVFKPITAPAAGTYKIAMNTTAVTGKVLYFSGTINDKGALETSENMADAVDVVIAEVAGKDGVYTIQIGGKYLEGYLNGTYNNMRLVDNAAEWTWNAELGTFVCTFIDKNSTEGTFYFGAYLKNDALSANTMSLSYISYATGSNASKIDVSQFVGRFGTFEVAEDEDAIPAPADGTYKMYLNQVTLGQTLYWAGTVNSSEHCDATTDANAAAIITIAKVGENAYTIKLDDKFLEIYINSSDKSRARLVDTANGTWAWDSTIGIFTWTIEGTSYYLGTFDSNGYIRASALSYITGENASKLGVSQFVCQYEAAEVLECEHAFDNNCDNSCNLCGDPNPNFADHVDADPANCVCDVCEAALDHVDADTNFVCDVCSEGLCNHAFDNNCDNECNNCGAANPDYADHVDVAEADCVCDVCEAPLDHKYDNACDADCNVCGETRTPEDHVYTHKGDATCNVCGDERTVEAPVNNVTGADLSTIPAILEIGAAKDHNTYTTDKYLVIGYVDDVYQTTYGNMHIVDENGNILTVYGTYNNDGTTRYDALTVKPVAGDVVVIYGVVGQFNGTPQIKNGWIMQINDTVLGNVHSVCTEFSDATCTEPAKCLVCGKENGEALGHKDTDPADCVCDVCETAVAHSDADEDSICDICEADLSDVPKEITAVYGVASNFSTYAESGWTNSYAEHVLSSAVLGTDLPEATITLSRASKQTGTITDKPVLATKTTDYVTVEITEGSITSVTFALQQWTTKTFTDIHIEYFDGTNWVSCSNVITTPADITSTTIPAGVTKVRLVVSKSSSSNTQVGIGDITLVIA